MRPGEIFYPLCVAFTLLLIGCMEELLLDNPYDPNSPLYVPKPPSLYSVSASNDKSVRLLWSRQSLYPDHHEIERRLSSSGTYIRVGVVPGSSTMFFDTSNITTDSIYYYRVLAVGKSGNSSASNDAVFRLTFNPPTGLGFGRQTQDRISLFWQDNSSFETGFKIERSVNNGPFVTVDSLPANETEYNDSLLTTSSTYEYRIFAFTDRNVSGKTPPLKLGFLGPGTALLQEYFVGNVSAMSVDRLGANIATDGPGQPSSVRIWRLTSGVKIREVFTLMSGRSIAFDPSGYNVASISGNSVYLISVQTGYLGALQEVAPINSVEYSPEGQLLFLGLTGGTSYWSVSARSKIRAVPQDSVIATTVSSDGSLLACISPDSVVLRSVSNGTAIRTIAQGLGRIVSGKLRPGGQQLALGMNDGMIRIFNVSDGQNILSWNAGSPVRSIDYSPDGQSIVSTGSSSGDVTLWDANSGGLLHNFSGHTQRSIAAAFTVSGKIIVSASNDMTVRVWSRGNHWWVVP